ncbi:MAG TPA: glycosyltransferase family 2 protein [Ohtaekwangia sp.]|uniref:glycosyltransferase family 2 protein n=1 Tax=Ohtaekwangia sp. TaxID=2066019 RepID=UPI002F94B991
MPQLITKKISVVIPVFNEASNIEALYRELITVFATIRYAYEFIFVDDGSTDESLAVIKKLSQINEHVFYIELSRNFGHQYALKAGLDLSNGDCAISMDCDLQHPPEVILSLIAKWEEGFDVVYTCREEDKKLPWLKRKTSKFFYTLLNRLSDIQLEHGTADFRLMNRNVLNAFTYLNENEFFIRGLIKWAGFRQTAIKYTPRERHSGDSKYNLKKMLSFALRGITSFSVKPLQMIAYLGLGLFMISLILIPYALVSYLLGEVVSGWTSIMISIIFFGSLQLLMMGIIGIYISKLVIQSKQRPLYFIRETNYDRTTHQSQIVIKG